MDIRVTWYSSDGTIISEGSDISIHKAVKGQKYAFDLSYYDEKSPSKAEIRVYDGLGEDNCIYNQTVNLT